MGVQQGFAAFVVMWMCAAVFGADWPQWGGTNNRNMISAETHLPGSFEADKGKVSSPGGAANVKWVAPLGSYAYGNPTVAEGRVFVGVDARTLTRDKRFKSSRGGMVKCFGEATGEMRWQLHVPVRKQLPAGALYTQFLGVCSSPTVDGDRVYVVSNAVDVLCLDVEGQADGNDGPFVDEGRYMAGEGNSPIELGPKDGDIVWRFDLIDEAGIVPHDAASCSVLIVGDVLYTGTSNGVDKPHEKVLAPDAPSLIALDKKTGRLLATDNEKIGRRLWHCQWASPSSGVVNGRTLVFFGGGDGICYAFEALTSVPAAPVHLKKVWSYDCDPPEYRFRDGKAIAYYAGDRRKKNSPNKNDGRYLGPSQIIGTPVFCNNRVYVAIGQDPAHGRGRGLLHCIDATQRGDITASGAVWTYDGMDRSLATVAVADGLVYAMDVAGRLHCLDAETGEKQWVYETGAEAWGGPLVADGKLYFGNKERFRIMTAGRAPQLLCEQRLGCPIYSTAIAANGTLYVASSHDLWALAVRP